MDIVTDNRLDFWLVVRDKNRPVIDGGTQKGSKWSTENKCFMEKLMCF